MKFGNSVAAHQPDEAVVGVALLELADRVDGVASARATLEIADLDARSAGNLLGGGEAILEGRTNLASQPIARAAWTA